MYNIRRKLGQGAFGIVYHLHLSNGNELALKVAEIGRLKGQEIDAVAEARLMLKLTHAHLVQCCASFNHGNYVYLVMELCRHGTLKNFLNIRTKLVQESQVLTWLGQMADALRYLHASRVIHRDLKTDNVFLDDRRHVKIGDLGIARELDYTAQRAGTFIGTFCYMSPEILQSSTYSYETDIWSLGCCVHEVMTLHQTFAAQSMMEIMENIMEAKIPSMPDLYCKKLQKLVIRMLDRKAKKRPDGLEIIFTVSKIQGFPFESGPYTLLERGQIDQKLLCKAVQDFEHIFSENEFNVSHKDESTFLSINAKDEETREAVETDNVGLLEEQCLKTQHQPRPLPRCRYIIEDVPVTKSELTAQYQNLNNENLNKLPNNKMLSKQNHKKKRKPQVQHHYNLQDSSASSSHPSAADQHRFASSTLSSLSDSTPPNNHTISSKESHVAESVSYTDVDDAGMRISKYVDHLAAESRKWLRLKLKLSEDRNMAGQVIDDEYDSDSLVTLYTRAQMARYNNKKSKSTIGHVI